MKILLFAAILMSGFAHAKDEAAVKLGFVDMTRAIQGTSAGKKAKSDLEAEFNKKQKEIQKKEGDLKKMQEDLEKKKLALTEEVLMKKQGELQQEMLNYRQFVGDSQVNIQKRERELAQPILQKLEKVISKYAENEGFTMIFDRGGVLWGRKDADLTDKIIAAYEKTK